MSTGASEYMQESEASHKFFSVRLAEDVRGIFSDIQGTVEALGFGDATNFDAIVNVGRVISYGLLFLPPN